MLSMIGEWRQSASIPKQAPAASPPLVNDLFGIRQMLALLNAPRKYVRPRIQFIYGS